MSRRQPPLALLVFGAERAVAAVEQYKLLPGVYQRRGERMFVAVSVDAVYRCQRLNLSCCRFAAKTRGKPRADHLGIHDGRDFEAAELEAKDVRLHFALH